MRDEGYIFSGENHSLLTPDNYQDHAQLKLQSKAAKYPKTLCCSFGQWLR